LPTQRALQYSILVKKSLIKKVNEHLKINPNTNIKFFNIWIEEYFLYRKYSGSCLMLSLIPQWDHSVYVIYKTNSQITLSVVHTVSYCYHSVNDIRLTLAQSDPIKQLPLYYTINRIGVIVTRISG
jgi:hypothetical protein